MKPSAHLFGNGNAIYFDENGEQIVQLQRLGLSGIHHFVERYPEGEVFWSIWNFGEGKLDREAIPWLLRHIRKVPGRRPKQAMDDVRLNDNHSNGE